MRYSASYVFILALGCFLKRVGVFGKQDYKVLTQVVLCITLPAAVITNFASMEWRASLLMLPALGFSLCCVMLLLGQFLSRRSDAGTRALFMENSGEIRLPVLSGTFLFPISLRVFSRQRYICWRMLPVLSHQ